MNAKESSLAPSSQEGMGALVYEGACAFRVWAPHADAVYVTGSFNDWAEEEAPLAREENGFWSGDVPTAGVGDEYKYRIVNGDQALMRNDPYARMLGSGGQNTVISEPTFDWGDAQLEMPSWNDLVIYELHVGTFHDRGKEGPGTFEGVIEKLDYLKDLGVNALQLMPVTEFPGGISWGYNPSHPFTVETGYGGPQGLKELVKAAHEAGLAILLDVVYNHFGPSDLDLWRFDGWYENEKGGIYFYNDVRAHTPWGDTRPDYGRDEVRRYIRDNAMMWLHEYRLDGLRWDATAYIRTVEGHDNDRDLPHGWSLLQWLNGEINGEQPWKLSIAEDVGSNDWIVREPGDDGAGFDAQWDTLFVRGVRDVLLLPDDESRDLQKLAQLLARRYNSDAFERIIYTESHDDVANGKARIPEEIDPEDADSQFAKKRSALGAALVLTAPGVPLLFQGQEFLEDGWFQDEKPLDWSRLERFGGIHALYRDLIHLRRNLEGTTAGLQGQHLDVFHVNDADKIIAYHRWKEGGPGDNVVVLLNLANQAHEGHEVGFPRGGRWQVRFNSDWQGYDEGFSDFGGAEIDVQEEEYDGQPFKGNLDLAPYGVLILSQDE